MDKLKKSSHLIAFLGSYILAYLYTYSLFFSVESVKSKIGFCIFAGLFLLWGYLIFPQKWSDIPKESLFWAALTVALTVAGAVDAGNAVGAFLSLALHAVAVYTLLSYAGALWGETGFYSPGSLLFGLVVYPFGNFFLRLVDLFKGISAILKKATLKKTLTAIISFLAALVLLVVAVLLLSMADANFGKFFAPLLKLQIPEWLSTFFGRFVVSLPVGAYFYGLYQGIKKDREKLTEREEKLARFTGTLSRAKVVGSVYLSCLIGLFCLLYIAFFALQGSYLFGAFRGVLPQGFTVSSYAREGFFQLIMVGGLNFLLLGCAYLFGKESPTVHPALRLTSLILMAETFLLSLTALSKVFLYIRLYGFTPLRYSSFWACLVLMAGIALAVVSVFKNIKGMQKWIFFAAATFAVLAFF